MINLVTITPQPLHRPFRWNQVAAIKTAVKWMGAGPNSKNWLASSGPSGEHRIRR